MRGDGSNIPQFEGPRGLPAVTGVEVSRVRFDPPMRFYSRGVLVEHRQAVQLLVSTTGPLPGADVTPAIFIGDLIVNDYEQVGTNLYRFLVFDVEKLRPGAPIALGWPFAPLGRLPTDFRFNLSPPPLA